MGNDKHETDPEPGLAEGPAPEMGEVVDDFIPGPAELAVIDPSDRHEVMLRMDDHDVRMILERAQKTALRKWVYELKGRKDADNKPVRGLTVHAVQDITQQMNWMGKCRIGLLPETLTVERIVENAGNGDEPFWVATIFAKDEMTGAMMPGSSMEPQRMQLKKTTADAKRGDGKSIPEDNKVFDPFSRTKAIQKATRNALAAFIPEEVEQSIIAMFGNDPARVERIRTEAEQKIEDRPPPLNDEEAKRKIASARALYDEIRELGGSAVTEFTPGKFGAYLLNAQHSQESLEAFVDYVIGERDRLVAKYRTETAA